MDMMDNIDGNNVSGQIIEGIRYGYDYQYENIEKNQKCFGFHKNGQLRQRKITSNRPDYDLTDNTIQTNKYTYLNFLPKNLMEQFSKRANIYFLVIGVMQAIPQISISYGIPVIYLPLLVIIMISMLKDFVEDYKRIQADREENSRKIEVMDQSGAFKFKLWKDLKVGNIIKIKNNNYMPCDILLLQTSDNKGESYIETKNLDGETNLKMKKVSSQFNTQYNNQQDQDHTKFCYNPIVLEYDKPVPIFDRFKGKIFYQQEHRSIQQIKVSLSNLILRGSKMKNTDWAIGMACYTGHDTKIMQNMYKPKPKKSNIEIGMGKYIFIIFGIQNFLCLVCASWYLVWYNQYKGNLEYIDIADEESKGFTNVTDFIIYYFAWMLIFTNFVPISLLVTLEVVKFIQGFLMQQDSEMGNANVQTSNLNEELGQIKYIFSDKTGTLTCNNMDFKKFAIATTVYGDQQPDDYERYIKDSELSAFPKVTNVDFRDKLLIQIINDVNHEKHGQVIHSLFFLALCHTVTHNPTNINQPYSATSPDELALVNFAKFCGVEYIGTNSNEEHQIKFNGKIYRFQRLQVFDFTSQRKRMSVIYQELDAQTLHFKFDNKNIQNKTINFNGKTVTKVTTHGSLNACIGIAEQQKTITNQQFQFDIKINKMGAKRGIALGVCQRKTISSQNYEFYKEQKQHGCYLLNAQGYSYSHHDERSNNTQNETFSFEEGDVISCIVEQDKQLITFKKSQGIGNLEFQMNINYEQKQKYLYPIVLLYDQHDSVTIENGQIKEDKIFIFTKGADSVIIKGCQDSEQTVDKTMKILMNFGKIGLRTLLLGEKQLSKQQYKEWEKKFEDTKQKADELMDIKLEEMQNELEQNLTLVGATGIEDKLQEEVPETIRALRDAGIKLWVLTGDKVETAINVGFSCKLLDISMQRFEITEEEEGQLTQNLQDALSEIENQNPGGKSENDNFALVISGEALYYLNIPQIQLLIYQIGQRCKVLICCRVTPQQKEQIVSTVRKLEPQSSTLAIGDGANDVNMITAAHVGVGIKGVEGQQAARASDYSLNQFKFLRKLLFYHGRECYRRNSQIVCYNFYKNVVLVLPQFWYGFTNQFSGQTLYDPYLYQFFNMFFSSIPIMIYAIYDEEVKNGSVVMTENKVRNFYKQGLENKFFKPSVFWKQYIIGLLQAGIIVLISVYSLESNFILAEGVGYNMNFWQIGTMVFSMVVLVVNLKIIIISFTMSIGYWIFIWISWLSYLAFWYGFSYFSINQDIYNTFQSMNFALYFHLGNLLGIVVTSGIDYFLEIYDRWQYQLEEKIKGQVKKIHLQNLNNQNNIRRRSQKEYNSRGQKQVIKVKINYMNTGFNFSSVDNNNDQYE